MLEEQSGGVKTKISEIKKTLLYILRMIPREPGE